MSVPIGLGWQRREPPLPAAAVAALGDAAGELCRATLRRLADGADVRAAAGSSWLVVLADEADLPWVSGAIYLGWDGGMLTPTTHAPWPPADLSHRAIKDWAPAGCDLIVLLPHAMLASPRPARVADPARLASLVGR
jgi:hypothetical protein